jgi:hypothetical protein
MAEDSFWRIVPLLAVKSVNAPEVRDTAFGGNTCTTEKHNTLRVFYNFGELFDIFHD